MATTPTTAQPANKITKRKPKTRSKTNPHHQKLPRLPSNAILNKRPLHRPPIPSAYTSSAQEKVIYISTHTPFLSAIKRAEKLLQLGEKRDLQSATRLVHNNQSQGRGGKRKRAAGGGTAAEDEILEIAEVMEAGRKRNRLDSAGNGGGGGGGGGEAVVFKGTGKAVFRVLELGLWFQKRREEYAVELRTGSVWAVDDVVVADGEDADENHSNESVGPPDGDGDPAGEGGTAGAEGGSAEVEDRDPEAGKEPRNQSASRQGIQEEIPETRIRYTSVLEVAVSLR